MYIVPVISDKEVVRESDSRGIGVGGFEFITGCLIQLHFAAVSGKTKNSARIKGIYKCDNNYYFMYDCEQCCKCNKCEENILPAL